MKIGRQRPTCAHVVPTFFHRKWEVARATKTKTELNENTQNKDTVCLHFSGDRDRTKVTWWRPGLNQLNDVIASGMTVCSLRNYQHTEVKHL